MISVNWFVGDHDALMWRHTWTIIYCLHQNIILTSLRKWHGAVVPAHQLTLMGFRLTGKALEKIEWQASNLFVALGSTSRRVPHRTELPQRDSRVAVVCEFIPERVPLTDVGSRPRRYDSFVRGSWKSICKHYTTDPYNFIKEVVYYRTKSIIPFCFWTELYVPLPGTIVWQYN